MIECCQDLIFIKLTFLCDENSQDQDLSIYSFRFSLYHGKAENSGEEFQNFQKKFEFFFSIPKIL